MVVVSFCSVIGVFILARTSAGAMLGLMSWKTFLEKSTPAKVAASAPVTVEGRLPRIFATVNTAFLAVQAATLRKEPMIVSWAMRSMRFRPATWLNVMSSRWSIEIILGANNFGLILLKMESRMSGMINVTAPMKPGLSRSLEILTNVSESLARRFENSCTASTKLLSASSMQSEKIETSSSAEFAPRPKYGYYQSS